MRHVDELSRGSRVSHCRAVPAVTLLRHGGQSLRNTATAGGAGVGGGGGSGLGIVMAIRTAAGAYQWLSVRQLGSGGVPAMASQFSKV